MARGWQFGVSFPDDRRRRSFQGLAMWTIEFDLITTLLVSENPDYLSAGSAQEAPATPTPAGPGPTPRS